MTIEIRVEQAPLTPIEYRFDRSHVVLGRHPFNDLVVSSPGLAARHGRLALNDGQLRYEDLGSRLGSKVLVQGDAVMSLREDSHTVTTGDAILIGEGDAIRITILAFQGKQRHRLERFPLPYATAPSALLSQMTEEVRDRAVDALSSILSSASLEHASIELQKLVEGLLPSAHVAFVLPQDESFLDVVLDGHAKPGDCAHVASPDSSGLRKRLACCQYLEILPRDTDCDLLMPFGHPEHAELPGYIRIQVGAQPEDRVLELLAGLMTWLRPAIMNLLELGALRREQGILKEENAYFRGRARRHYLYKELVSESQAMKTFYTELEPLLEGDIPALLLGEAGSGKKLIARAMHHLGDRSEAMFIAQSCAELAESDLDLELFGYTDARLEGKGRKGLFELADGGTLFLDEIDRLSPQLQIKLVRALHEHEIRRYGESEGRTVNVRVVAGTHRNIKALVDSGHFRRDLFSAFGKSTLRVPPLRERLADIAPLANHFIRHYARRYGLDVKGLSEAALERLLAHRWPGNVRELQVVIEAAVIKTDAGTIEEVHLELA